jgi:outer membrane protein assembly factor BamB
MIVARPVARFPQPAYSKKLPSSWKGCGKGWLCVALLAALTPLQATCQPPSKTESPSTKSVQTGPNRSILAADYQKKILALVDSRNQVRWRIPIQDIHDAQSLKGNHWLVQTSFTNVVELDSTGKEVWRFSAKPTADAPRIEIHAFRRLPNGLTMIAESGAKRVIEIDRDKNVVRSFPLTVEHPHPHRDTRLVRPTSTGTYLVAHESDMTVREYQPDGKVVWSYPVGSKVYSAVRLKNGNTLIGTGDGHRVMEVDSNGNIAWELGEKDLPGCQLHWVTMVDALSNGNIWIVNCHAGPDNPQVIEVTRDKKIVWSFKDWDRFGNALSVAIPVD